MKKYALIRKMALAAVSLAVFPFNGLAIPAHPGLVPALQPDGSIVNIYLKGDDFNKSVYSSDGYLLTNDAEGYYVFADCDEKGIPRPTALREINPEMRTAATKAALLNLNQKVDAAALREMRKAPQAPKFNGPGLFTTQFPSMGEQPSVVILVEFKNNEFTIENPREYFTRMLNEEGFSDYYATGSARDYFVKNSAGLFKPQFDVFGPVKLSKPMLAYGGNDAGGNDVHPERMIIEACELIDDEVDFSKYDRNGDGYIDNVYVFYAGYGEADGGGTNTIWPHSADITKMVSTPYFFDGVGLDHYACSNELSFHNDGIPDGIGCFCHEFSHVMGLPDLYNTLPLEKPYTPCDWDILDTGAYHNMSRTPPAYSSFERYALDWLEPVSLSEGMTELKPLDDTNVAYIAQTENENEYYLFENRQQKGQDSFIPGHGMLVWHIDYNIEVWDSNKVNCVAAHQYVDLVEADDIRTFETSDGDSFPGTAGVTSFTKDTTPAFLSWNKKPLPFGIYDIEETEDGVVRFNVKTENASVKTVNAGGLISLRGNCVTSLAGAVAIYDLKGSMIEKLNGSSSITLPSGFYIAVAAEKTVKFVIP